MALTDNIVSYWKFDNASGSATDSAGSNTGTNNNSVTYSNTLPVINNHAVFNGSNQSFSVGTSLLANYTGLTIAAWFKTSSTGAYRNIIRKTNSSNYNFWLRITDGNKLSGQISNASTENGLTGGTTLSANTWYFGVVTYDGAHINLYLNASSDATQVALTGNTRNTSDTVYIGADVTDGAEFWNGSIDEMGIWSRALSGAEITSLYNGGAGNTYPFASAPSVSISAASPIWAIKAQGNGNVTSDGGATVTERGFCWSTSANPTTSDSKVIVSGTTGAYNGIMTPLVPGTFYHYRAYAINSTGTSYASDTTFTTLPISTTYLVGRGRNRERLNGISLA